MLRNHVKCNRKNLVPLPSLLLAKEKTITFFLLPEEIEAGDGRAGTAVNLISHVVRRPGPCYGPGVG